MATTFHTVQFKNKTLDLLTGVSTSATPIFYANPYNGAQAADPSFAPVGAFEFAAATSGPNLNTQMTASGGGISQLSAARSPTTPANALSTASITTVRLFNTSSQALIDVVASVAGGGGGIILDSLNANAGVGSIVKAFSLKLPLNNGGTFSMNAQLVDRLVDLWGGASSQTPYMGINTSGTSAFQLWDGTAPASADLPATGNLLLTTNLGGANIWAAASGGAAALASFPASTALYTSTPTYARLTKTFGAFTFVMQGSVGTAATDFVVSTMTLVAGVTSVALNEATISL